MPYRDDYDIIVIKYMMEKNSVYLYYTKQNKVWSGQIVECKAPFYSLQSWSKLYRAIRDNGYPTVSRSTVQGRLNKMVEKQVLVRYPKSGRYNQTLFRLDRRKMLTFIWKQVNRKKWFESLATAQAAS